MRTGGKWLVEGKDIFFLTIENRGRLLLDLTNVGAGGGVMHDAKQRSMAVSLGLISTRGSRPGCLPLYLYYHVPRA